MGTIKAATIETEFTGNTRSLDRAFQQSEQNAKKFASNVGRTLSGIGGGGSGGGGSLFSSITGAIQMLPGLGMLAGGLSSVAGAMKDGIKFGFDYNRVLEENSISFEVMLKSGSKAKTLLSDLARIAEKSPFEFPEVIQTTKQMLAMGYAVDEIKQRLLVFSDTASALGVPMEQIVRALGQMRAKGKVSAEEMNQLAEAGVPAWQYLADALAKTDKNFEKLTSEQRVAKLMKLAQAGQLSAKGAEQAISIGMREQFGGVGARVAAETASGLEANLNDVAARLAGTATGPFFERYKNLLRGTLEVANSETAAAVAKGAASGSNAVFNTIDEALKQGGNIGAGLVKGVGGSGFNAAKQFIGDFATGIGAHSPATEFIPLGEMAAQGFKIGFGKEMEADGGVMGLFQSRGGRNLGGMSERSYLEQVSQNPTVKAFFEAIRRAEGGRTPYVMAGRAGRDVNSGRLHPGEVVPISQWFRGDRGPSSAAGYYQITRTNWRNLAPALGLDNFSDPHQQLLAALKLFADRDHGAGLRSLLSGDVSGAMRVAAKDWTSTPGSTIGGGGQVKSSRWLGYFSQALQGGDPVPVTVVGGATTPSPRGDLTGGTGMFAEKGALDFQAILAKAQGLNTAVTDLDASMIHLTSVSMVPLQSLPGTFSDAAQQAAGLNSEIEQTAPILQKANEEASFLGVTTKDASAAFQQSWVSAFTRTDQDFKGLMSSFVLSFADALNQMVQQWAAARIAKGIGNFLGSLFGGGGNMFGGSSSEWAGGGMIDFMGGFATGGSFKVGGPGGTDSRLVAFKATPGEEVTVSRPGQGGAQTIINKTTIINYQPKTTPDSYSTRRGSREALEGLLALVR